MAAPPMEVWEMRQYGIPDAAVEVSGAKGYKLNWSELAIYTGKAGKRINKLWSTGYYGYAELEDGSFIHGCLHIHESDNSISLS